MNIAPDFQRYRWHIGVGFVVLLIVPPAITGVICHFVGASPAEWISVLGQWLSALFAAAAAVTATLVYRAQTSELSDSKEALKAAQGTLEATRETLRVAQRDHTFRHYDWRSELSHSLANQLVGGPKGLDLIREIIEGKKQIPEELPRSYRRKWDRFRWTVGSLYEDCERNGMIELLGGPLEIIGEAFHKKDPILNKLRAAFLHETSRKTPGA